MGRPCPSSSKRSTEPSTADVDRSARCRLSARRVMPAIPRWSCRLSSPLRAEAKRDTSAGHREAQGDHAFPGVVVHESRRLGEPEWTDDGGLPCTEDARSAIDAAVWQPWPRFACRMVAAAVQQRLCTPRTLTARCDTSDGCDTRLICVKRSCDIRGASQRSERDRPDTPSAAGSACRRRAADEAADRARWLALPRCRVGVCLRRRRVVLEVDGAHHWTLRIGRPTCGRERGIVIGRRWVLRATSVEVRLEPRHDRR